MKHILIAGKCGSGKSTKMVDALSKMEGVAGFIVSLGGTVRVEGLESVDYSSLDDAIQETYVEIRDRLNSDKVRTPYILAIDELDLCRATVDIADIVSFGREVGVYIIACTQRPSRYSDLGFNSTEEWLCE